MKIKLNSLLFLFAVTTTLCITNCTIDKKEKADSTDEKVTIANQSDSTTESNPQFQVDSNFKKQLTTVFAAYVELKDAFVASDAMEVKTKASKVALTLNGVDMKLLSGAAHNDWMNYHSSIQSSLKEIESSTDIETQRNSFSSLSDTLYKSMRAFGHDGNPIYYQYCPMAFNNEGGYWLSDKEQIRNPYFGDKMLTCGSVKQKLE
jgi:Protein of unknown function (DUF3347)